jgi:GDP-4-dehydro-6-deoxy-D-mannose reductase
MRTMVTGAAGFVGRHLVRELSINGHEPLAVVHESDPLLEECETIQADLSAPEAVRGRINFKSVDVVIHLAGLTAVGASFSEPMKFINNNVGAEVNLFEASLKQQRLVRFLIISSGAVYDPRECSPFTEDSRLSPTSPYAVSKIAQEQMVAYYGKRGFEYVIARPFNHIGPGQSEGFIVPDIAKQIVAVEKGQADTISVGSLGLRRDYTDVRDIVRAYRLLIEEEGTQAHNIYNICSGKSYSGQQILDGLLAHGAVEPKIVQDEARLRPADAPNVVGSNDRIKQDVGWQPQIKLDQTLKETLEDWRQR